MADQGSSGRPFRASRSLFYGKKDTEKEAESSESELFDSDDSVDDPNYRCPSDDNDDTAHTSADISGIEPAVLSDEERGDDGDDNNGENNNGDNGDDANGGVRDVGGDVGAPRGRERQRGRGGQRPKRGRVAKRGLSEKQVAKKKRDAGQEYTSRSGKKVAAREVGPACRDGCYDRVSEHKREAINRNFWALKNYNAQNSYISQHVRETKIKRRYGRGVKTLRTQFEYDVKYLGETYKVCAVAFRNIHSIGEKRIQIQMRRMRTSLTGTPPGDLRGKKVPPNKVTGTRLARVHEHIRSLPTTASHYSRAKSPHRVYLEAGGSITGEQGLYRKYKYWMEENGFEEEPVTESFYRKVFATEYNIGFKPPKKDTCAKCDEMDATMKGMEEREEDTSEIRQAKEEHLAIAKTATDLLGGQEKLPPPEEGDLVIRSVAMDLQQTLPCPRISTGMAYYMRKMWVYNFCIFDLQKSKGSMFMWDEVTGGRGSDEVSSCLLKWIDLRLAEEEFDVLRIFCDNCAGQNKNIFVILAALRLIHARKLFRIEVIFMVSGHSFLPCDARFGVIEKKIRGQEAIHTTGQYIQVVKDAARPPFEVIAMQREDFFNIKELQKYITKRATPIPFKQARQLIVDAGYKEGFLLKADYALFTSRADCFQSRLMKGVRKYSDKAFNLSEVALQPKYAHEILLDKQKLKDLDTLTQFMGPSTSRNWMQDLLSRQRLLQEEGVAPTDEEDEESDVDNDLDDYSPPCRPTH